MTTETLTPDPAPEATAAPGAKAKQAYGSARDTIAGNVGPLADKARGFAKQRPFAAAALAGVVGLAILNTLRGKR